ncbi:LuxR C-terminal-related transcriptional regulator [Eggerthellaceae bacterium 24-137]
METIFYLYTILIMVACVAAGSVCLSAYFVSRQRSYIYAAFMFLFYFLDMALIFQYEYLGQNLAYSFESFYGIDRPLLRTVLAAAFLQSLWLLVCDFENEQRIAARWVPLAVFLAACAITLLCLPEGPFRQWLYFTLRQLFLLWGLGYVIFRYCTCRSSIEKARMRRKEPLLFVAFGLILCILIEDIFMMLLLDPATIADSLLPLYLSERNFSENFLILAFVIFAVRAAASTLRLRFKEPPAADNPDLRSYIDELLPAYCECHGLTAREREILQMVLEGKDNQNIASSLQLALGTVKAHVHNILKKTGSSTRQELTQNFWKG